MDAMVEQPEQVVGDNALDDLIVVELQPHPQAVQFGSAEKDLAFGFEVLGKFAHKVDALDVPKRNGLMFPVRGEQINGVVAAELYRVQVAANIFAVKRPNDHFLVRGG